MYLSLNWLKEYVKFKQTPEQVAEVLTLGGFEVEKVNYWGKGMEGIVVGQVKTIISHAEADKLSVCKVDIGKAQPLTIVCGAKNVKAGQKVPVAVIDSVLPNGMKIERRRIRGIDSEGMICAEDELGLGENHAGIMVLDENLKVGKKFGQAVGISDAVLDLAISPNRADGFSVLGLAREFAAMTGQKMVQPKISLKESKKHSVNKLLTVKVADYDLCPKYTARVVKNVKVKQSPDWLKARLMVSGVKPVNNIVDITNFVMLEMGQPLHAFDYAKVNNKKIIVRKAGSDKTFATLDGEQRKLTTEILMIADSKEPVAIAGVMGGVNSVISNKTKDVVIESAIFKPLSIRKTRQKLGLVTEASTRFEKGIWWDLPEIAADRAAQLMAELAGGEIAKGMIIASKVKEVKSTVFKVSVSYINKLIGRNFSQAEIIKYLESLEFGITKISKDEIKVTVPTWRQDIKIPADIVEEVGRMYGWNNLKTAPIYSELKPVALEPEQQLVTKIKDTLVACGMTEVLNYSFYSQDHINRFEMDVKEHYRIENPFNPDQEYLRQCLLPRMHKSVLDYYQTKKSISIFEIGKIFEKSKQGLSDEQLVATGLIWQKKSDLLDSIKQILNSLFKNLLISDEQVKFRPGKETWYLAEISINDKAVGEYGQVNLNLDKLHNPPTYFTLYIDNLLEQMPDKRDYQPLSNYPAIEHDLSFIVADHEIDYWQIQNMINKIDPLIKQVQPIDWHSQNKSATVRVTYQSEDRTLKSEDVESVEKKIISEMSNKFNMRLKK